MYSYIIAADYRKQIQDVNLQQVISSTQSILESAQMAAEAEAKSYLRQKYDVSRELAATKLWQYASTYSADDTIYLDAPAYSATSTYLINALTLNAGNVYICTTAITVGETFNPSKWTLLGVQYQLFYGKVPFGLFDMNSIYKVGDQVFLEDKVYTAAQATTIITPNIQYQSGNMLPLGPRNVLPNDPIAGVSFWGAGVPYSIAANTLPTDTTKWVIGDNRDQQMVMYFVDITLYHVHSRIAPRNIPELRIDRYDAAIKWLKMCARGEVTPELPVLQPKQGRRIRFGGNPKAINNY